MATTIRSNGLHHAISLGNIEVSSKRKGRGNDVQNGENRGNKEQHRIIALLEAIRTNSYHTPSRCYDSEDENMGRKKPPPSQATGMYPRTSVYSKGDIREQYCLTDRQVSSIERPRRERFFGCWSGRNAPQSFLGVCVGRRAPSDENIADYAPFYKYPRYHHHDGVQYDEDLDSSYFRRRPTSILSTSNSGAQVDPKRYTWMPADEEAVRLEGPRPICSDYDDFQRGPYVVGSYPPKSYLSQSTEQIAGLYRCPAHVGLPPPPPPPVASVDTSTPRTKHVSFARSHTLTSFDEAATLGLRSSGRLNSTRSQERLIGGKKTVSTPGHLQKQQLQQPLPPPTTQISMAPHNMQEILPPPIGFHHPALHHHAHHLQQHQQPSSAGPAIQHPTAAVLAQQMQQQTPMMMQHQREISTSTQGPIMVIQQPFQSQPEVLVVEKVKRSAMKTQATQTDVFLNRKGGAPHHLSLSPRTVHRVRMVSQGAQTNGIANGRKLTKSLSEMTGGRGQDQAVIIDEPKTSLEHEQLHRTYSEEPPRSPLMVPSSHYDERYFNQLPSSRPASSCRYTTDQTSVHSRNHSQDSVVSYRSSDMTILTPASSSAGLSFETGTGIGLISSTHSVGSMATTTASMTKTSQEMARNLSRAASASMSSHGTFDYQSNSLPRRTCGHHPREEFYTYSLPRAPAMYHQHEVCRHVTECSELLNGTIATGATKFHKPRVSRESSTDSTNMSMERRRASVGPELIPKTHAVLRRQSMPWQYQRVPIRIESRDTSEEVCSTCDSEADSNAPERQTSGHVQMDDISKEEEGDDEDEEQEIFIDFKPHISASPSPHTRRKKLQKTLSEGEILLEKRQDHRDYMPAASASDEDLSVQPNPTTSQEFQYQNLPIKDEGICDKQNLLAPPTDSSDGNGTLRMKREAFRKRSISLEDPTAEQEPRFLKSTPPSPCQEELSAAVQSAYPSTDSLTNDLTRDHSDGIWNESQATVLQAESRENELVPPLLTPSSRRKHLLLQHQQRSSIDTDALELEEQFSSDQSVPFASSPLRKPVSTQTVPGTKAATDSTFTASAVPPQMINTPTPSIAVIPSPSIEGEDHQVPMRLHPSPRRSSRTLSPALQERRNIEPMVHVHSPQRPIDSPATEQSAPHPVEQLLNRVDSGPKTNTDVSECSTNTDDYVTCTDTSKRAPGMKTPPTASSSSTQVPVSAQSSQTATHEGGSSFESASSLYSTRGDGLSEEHPHPDDSMTPSAESAPVTSAPSPAHSVSSSSSGSYNLTNLARNKVAAKATSPLRASAIIKPTIASKKKSESVSEDERSEKRYSSSGYYESPHDEDHRQAKWRKQREWNDDERRRRRSNMKLDIERENIRALTSPLKKSSPGVFKQISPEDRAAMNILDGTSPNKAGKRFRTKIRRQTRNRSTSGDDTLSRKPKISISKSPEHPKAAQSSHANTMSAPVLQRSLVSPKKCKEDANSEKRLKAKSSESLRSVSPGSDSVFYSEGDLTAEQQVHCSHCGKEVEIVTAASGSQESIAAATAAVDEDNANGPDIVKPPADFADSPVTTKTSQRLYKKMDKRFRSEERHGDRRHYRSRQDNARAKSEERGKEQMQCSPPALRPAGSSPCVMPDRPSSIRSHGSDSSEQGIFHGNYRLGLWVWLTDRDIWQQHNLRNIDRGRALVERRGSTETEEDFRKKFQSTTHRLVHRKSCFEMYRRQTANSFSTDKTITVCSKTGEFGFRIHGSKPVVVSAIEPDTPAETCGLEVGDILLSVNGIHVIDKNHSEVVKIAHDGCDTLEIEVARTIGILSTEPDANSSALYTGYLWRQATPAKGLTTSAKWVRRWFCLRPDHCLYYYKTDTDIQPVGAVLLTNHNVERCIKDIGKPHAFQIDSGEGSPLYLAADTEEAASRWVAIMSHASTQSDPWLEASTRYLRLPASNIPKPDCNGYLMKLGSRWRGWTKRYCVLKDACLYFFQDINSKTALGMACLQGYRAQPYSSNTLGKKFVFELIPCEGKLRHFYFSTESELDKKKWIAALDYSIERWMKAG